MTLAGLFSTERRSGAAVSGYFVGMLLKAHFVRPRPTVVPQLEIAYQTSFPSGHSMMSAIIYLTLGTLLTQFAGNLPRIRVYFVLCALFLTGIVGVSRVYLGVHYPSHVVGGYAAAAVWVFGVAWVGRLRRLRMHLQDHSSI